MTWDPIDGGRTIGTVVSEGTAVADEECDGSARITLEQHCVTAPFAITCGIYGSFVHTAHASTKAEAEQKYQQMKLRIEQLFEFAGDEYYAALDQFVDEFP